MTINIPHVALVSLLILPFAVAAQEEASDGTEIGTESTGVKTDSADDGASTDSFDPAEQTVTVAEEPDAEQLTTADAASDFDHSATSEERLLEEFARYRRLIQDGSLDEADVAAKRIVELAIKVYGQQSRETANALNNLGIVQHSNGQYDAAIQNFTSAVEIIEVVEDRLNDALINPLKGLGAAQLGSGRPNQARKTFTRAAHITQVNEGPHNLDQIEILESIAETNIRMGNTKGARAILDRIHIINVKHFEKNPLGLLPSLMSRAEWQHRAGYYGEERTTYRRAIRIIESSAGKNDPMLVEPLRRLGESFYFVDLSSATPQQQGLVSTGEIYFKRAARIAEKSELMDWRERARASMALGDYYTYVDSQNRSRKLYRKTWNQLSTDDNAMLQQRDEWFNAPVPLRQQPLPDFAGKPPRDGVSPEDIATGRIAVDYSVSSRGRIRDIKTEAFPPEFTDMQRLVHREIRSRVHRPRIVDGAPVQADELHFEHEFTYLKGDLEQLRAAANDGTEKQSSKKK